MLWSLRISKGGLGVAACVLATLLIFGTLSGCGGKTGTVKEEHLKVQLGWLMNAQSVGMAVAQQKGWYKEARLEVTISPGGPNIDAIQSVATGAADIGVAPSNGTIILARAQGVPVKAIGAFYQKHPYAFFYRPGEGIEKPSDLKGKKIGIQPTGLYLLEAFLGKVGLKKSDVTVVNIASDLMPLVTKQVDAASAWIINAGQRAAIPEAKYFLTYDYGLRYYAQVVFANEAVLREKSDAVARFMRETMRGFEYAFDHPEEAIELLMKTAPNLDKRLELETLRASIPLMLSAETSKYGLGYMRQDVWETGQQILIETGQMKQPIVITDAFTNDFITDNTPKR